MTDPIKIRMLDSARLTGRITNGEHELVTLLEPIEPVAKIELETDHYPIHLDIYDFEDASGQTWVATASSPWERSSDHVRLTFTSETPGDAYQEFDLEFTLSGTTTTARPPKLSIKVKPVIVAPDWP